MQKYSKTKTLRRGSSIMTGLRRQSTNSMHRVMGGDKDRFKSSHNLEGNESNRGASDNYKNLLIQASIEEESMSARF